METAPTATDVPSSVLGSRILLPTALITSNASSWWPKAEIHSELFALKMQGNQKGEPAEQLREPATVSLHSLFHGYLSKLFKIN